MFYTVLYFYLGIKTKVVDVTKKDQVEALAKEFEQVNVLFNVAGYNSFNYLSYTWIVLNLWVKLLFIII